jgi:hypothetical protein
VFSPGLISWHDVMNRVKESGPNFVQTSWHHKGPYTYGSSKKKCAVRATSSVERNFLVNFFEVVRLLSTGSKNSVTWVLTCAQRMNSILEYYRELIPNFKLLYSHLVVSPPQVRMLNLFQHQDSRPSLPFVSRYHSFHICVHPDLPSQHCDSLRGEV